MYLNPIFEYNLNKDIQGKAGKKDGIFFNISKIEVICFNNGIDWGFNDKQTRYAEEPFIIITKFLSWLGDNQEDFFNNNGLQEINTNLFIRTNGACIEKREVKNEA